MDPGAPTPHFSELSLMVWTELACCPKWSFSGRLGSPEMDSFGDPKWSHLGTRNGPVWGPEIGPITGTENRYWDRNEFVLDDQMR